MTDAIIAAPVAAPSPQHGGPVLAQDTQQAGADAFFAMAKAISDQAAADFTASSLRGEETYDYVRMAQSVSDAIQASYVRAGSLHRLGFVRAMVDLLFLSAHGLGVDPTEDWGPLENTESAFEKAPGFVLDVAGGAQ